MKFDHPQDAWDICTDEWHAYMVAAFRGYNGDDDDAEGHDEAGVHGRVLPEDSHE